MKIESALKFTKFRNGIDEHSRLNPLLSATLISIAYVLLVVLYIFLSSSIAANLSINLEKLRFLELSKGFVYTFVTGIVLFFVAHAVLKKNAQRDDLILSQNKQIISTERLVLAGLFSSSVGHDINNIMTGIMGNFELLKLSQNFNDEEKLLLQEISVSSKKIIELNKRMMAAGKNYVPGTKSDENLSQIIQDAVNFARVHRTIKTCKLELEISPDIYLPLNSILFSRTLMNLLLNSAEATNGKGQILVRLWRDADFARIEVHDNGPGIDDESKEKIFEPFYTSKENGNGLGLLSLKTCIQQHDGKLTIDKSHLGGACFCLALPAGKKDVIV